MKINKILTKKIYIKYVILISMVIHLLIGKFEKLLKHFVFN